MVDFDFGFDSSEVVALHALHFVIDHSYNPLVVFAAAVADNHMHQQDSEQNNMYDSYQQQIAYNNKYQDEDGNDEETESEYDEQEEDEDEYEEEYEDEYPQY